MSNLRITKHEGHGPLEKNTWTMHCKICQFHTPGLITWAWALRIARSHMKEHNPPSEEN